MVTGQLPLAYDLDSGWMWRLPGSAPWDERYIDALANLLDRLSPEELAARRSAVPRKSTSVSPRIANRTRYGHDRRHSRGAMNIAILCDSPDEQWPSMDLVGQMHSDQLRALDIPHQTFAPPIRRRTPSFALDRLLFRFRDYPALVRNLRLDLYHVIDHSYSQLLHAIPPARAVVTCHDLDTFRSILEPGRDPRGPAFRLMTRRILEGFRQAAHVACDSIATYDEVRKFDLIPPERLSVVPLGVHPSCSPEPDESADREACRLLKGFSGSALLHVGSTLPRKRIDVVLRTFAAARKRYPDLRKLDPRRWTLERDPIRTCPQSGLRRAHLRVALHGPACSGSRLPQGLPGTPTL